MKRILVAFSSFRDTLISPCFPSRNTAASQAIRHLDSNTRSALAETVHDDIQGISNEIRDIDQQLEHATTALKAALKNEKVLGSRYHPYRKALDERARALREERDEILHHKRTDPIEDEILDVRRDANVDNDNDSRGLMNDKINLLSPDVEIGSPNAVASSLHNDTELDTARMSDWEKRMELWEKDEDTLQSIHTTHLNILTHCEEMRRTIQSLQKKKDQLLKQSNQCQEFLRKAGGNIDDDNHNSFADEDIERQEQAENDNGALEMEPLRPEHDDPETILNLENVKGSYNHLKIRPSRFNDP
jgi:peptidoglycan hydrolase CwlO-like protein